MAQNIVKSEQRGQSRVGEAEIKNDSQVFTLGKWLDAGWFY